MRQLKRVGVFLLLPFFVLIDYDIYFSHLIGIATLLFVLLGVFLHKFNSVILLNRWTRMLAIIVMTFLFEMGAYILALVVGLTVDSMSLFIVYSLVPSMILNLIWMIIFQFIFEKFYL